MAGGVSEQTEAIGKSLTFTLKMEEVRCDLL